MSGHDQTGWEPDPQKMGNWRAMFEQPRHGAQPSGASASTAAPAGMPIDAPLDDPALAPDLSVYRPWILQRGGSRPCLMLDFRRYEPRSGLWSGWAIAYPYLVGMEYTGDRMLSFDFGKTQVMVVGNGLGELVRHIQQGNVIAVHEYAESLWPAPSGGPVVAAIQQVSKDIG